MLRALTGGRPVLPQWAQPLKSRYTLRVFFQYETGLGEDVCTSQVFLLLAKATAVIKGGLVVAGAKVAQSEDMDGIGVAGIDCVQTASKEQGIVDQVIVKMIPDELAELLSKL